MSANDIFFVLICVYLLVIGGGALATGRIVGFKTQPYTEESLKKFTKPYGIYMILLGISLGVALFGWKGRLPQAAARGGLGAVIILVVLYLGTRRRILVKKPQDVTKS